MCVTESDGAVGVCVERWDVVMRRCVYEVVCRFELKLCDVCNCVFSSQVLERSRRRMALERSKHKDGQVWQGWN